jgi:FkbH-like protein
MNLIELPWLLPAPPDFRQRCKDLETTGSGNLQQLAGHALDINQLSRLAKTIRKISPGRDTAALRLCLLSNATTNLLAPALIASAARYGVDLEVIEVPFGQAMQAVFDPASELKLAPPDLALLGFDHRLIVALEDVTDEKQAEEAVSSALSEIETLRDGLRDLGCGASLVQTLPCPPTYVTGSYDRRLPGSVHACVDRFNARLIEDLAGSEDILFDVAGLSEQVGLNAWHDDTQWHLAKLPFSLTVVPLYADHAARVLAAYKGKSRKCLILDLDNTLWGGIIGDDGLDGIVIGQGDALGEAHLEIQRTAKQLSKLGVILAVSSKNEDATARLPFQEHPDMLLKESDFAIFQANWQDKATNLQAIAKALDIGLDSLVLLDDNPAERAQVREALPQVAVPELPDDPALFSRRLLAAGYFETLGLSNEDLLRAKDYTARAERIELKKNTRDLGSYLASLDMEIHLKPFDGPGRSRITQLINKSNQFNLTTRRYGESQVRDMENDASLITLQVRLKDRFGDNGMISVVICRNEKDALEIDTWLMSCRVLGRRVEEAVLNELATRAHLAGMKALIGRYIPTDKNVLVRDLYENLGFELVSVEGKETVWRYDLDSHQSVDLPMQITSDR